MKVFAWDPGKNESLKDERHVSFEEVVAAIAIGGLLDVLEHHNQSKYPNQRLYVVNLHGYVCLVPFVESKDEVFLKTIIPSRKMTKKYLPGGEENE